MLSGVHAGLKVYIAIIQHLNKSFDMAQECILDSPTTSLRPTLHNLSQSVSCATCEMSCLERDDVISLLFEGRALRDGTEMMATQPLI